MSSFGLTYACQDVRDAQAELEGLLAQAQAAKLLTTHWFTADEGHPTAVAAQTLYKQVVNENLVIVSDDACAETAGKLRRASAELRALLQFNQTSRPDFTPSTTYDSPDTLDKLKPLFIAGAVVAGVVVLVPVVYEAVATFRAVRRTRVRGYRRRR